MYRRPKFLEILLEIRRGMALEVDYDVDLFAEVARSGNRTAKARRRPLGPASVDTPSNNGKLQEPSKARTR